MTRQPTAIDRLNALRVTLDTLHACNRTAMRHASPTHQTILAGFNRDAARLVLMVRTELRNGQRNERLYDRWERDVAELARHSEFYRASGRMTPTGRLRGREPMMHNVPLRTDLGATIRGFMGDARDHFRG